MAFAPQAPPPDAVLGHAGHVHGLPELLINLVGLLGVVLVVLGVVVIPLVAFFTGRRRAKQGDSNTENPPNLTIQEGRDEKGNEANP